MEMVKKWDSETWNRSFDMCRSAASQLRTNIFKGKIGKSQVVTKWRMCGKFDETINRIMSECDKLAQTKYQEKTLKNFGNLWNWEICAANWYESVTAKWYEHQPKAVIKNDQKDHVITQGGLTWVLLMSKNMSAK